MHWIYRAFILTFVFIISACAGIGYDSVLFHTRSNIGLDLDSVPATSEITIAREEGVIAPGFEGGKTLPVEASFKTNSRGLPAFFWGVDASFATGEAAVAMTALYGESDATLLKTGADDIDEVSENHSIIPDNKRIGFREYEGITVFDRPKKKSFFSFLPFVDSDENINYIERGLVKPLTFGTNTSLGVSMAWNTASKLPNSVKLGFNRKELAWVPVSIDDKDEKASIINIPSLLATISSNIKTKAEKGEDTAWMQHFATGIAATNLARRSDIRRVLLKDALPGVDAVHEWKQVADIEKAIYPGIVSCVNRVEDKYLGKIFFDAAYHGLLSDKEYRALKKSFDGWKEDKRPENSEKIKNDYLRKIKLYKGDDPRRIQQLINHQKTACLFALPQPV